MTGKRLTEEKYQGLGISEEVINSGMTEGRGDHGHFLPHKGGCKEGVHVSSISRSSEEGTGDRDGSKKLRKFICSMKETRSLYRNMPNSINVNEKVRPSYI